MLAVVVLSEGVQDRVGARALLGGFSRALSASRLFVDGGYTGALIG